MFLNHLQIVNYKNLKNVHFNFNNGTNTIIGKNDSGKSNSMTAIRLLLDDSYYYNAKRLRTTDFSDDLDNWKGHWIIVSAMFSDIKGDEKNRDACAEIVAEDENKSFLEKYIKYGEEDYGTVSLFIRPNKSIRRKLFQSKSQEELDSIRKDIRLVDYEFFYTARSQTDFTDKTIYEKFVGNFEYGKIPNPNDDDSELLGSKINIADIQSHISVVFIDALRDVEYDLKKPKNPIRRIIESIESQISNVNLDDIKEKIETLNTTISEIDEISNIGKQLTEKLTNMIGLVYAPHMFLESELTDDLNLLSKYIAMKPTKEKDIELLGLGHLNMIFVALKMVEFEFNRSRELLNIMIIEEPEAHIHKHIQKTLFDNLKTEQNYTQILMTTHSTYLSESSEISKMNIMKVQESGSYAMSPSYNLNTFGNDKLKLKKLELSECIERYLDVKRSALLFSKAIILVEGDGEEILIPNLIRVAFGINIDELGISIINVGSTSFEYIASLFHDDRINRKCSILTDSDKQLVTKESSHYKDTAEQKGKERKEKLTNLFDDNSWVNTYYAGSTLETEFAEIEENREYIKDIINNNYTQQAAIKDHLTALDGETSERANTVLTVANKIGKGWYAVLLSNEIDATVEIPDYIIQALSFSCSEVINYEILIKMIDKVTNDYDENQERIDILDKINKSSSFEHYIEIIKLFIKAYPDDNLAIFIEELSKHVDWLDNIDE